jgi:hypothetical protein
MFLYFQVDMATADPNSTEVDAVVGDEGDALGWPV